MTKEDFKSFVEALAKVGKLKQSTSYECKEFSNISLYAGRRDGFYVLYLRDGEMAVKLVRDFDDYTSEMAVDDVRVHKVTSESSVTRWVELREGGYVVLMTNPMTGKLMDDEWEIISDIAERYNAENEEEEEEEEEEGGEA